MRKLCFWRLFFVLIVVVIFVGGSLIVFSPWQEKINDISPPPSPQEPTLSLPLLPPSPQVMSDAQKSAAIEQAGHDAFTAALASGQDEDIARNAAERARIQARDIFYPTQP